MDSIIPYLLLYNQYLIKIIYNLLLFISKYIPLKQWAFDDSNSPDYQKFKVDKLPKIIKFQKVDYKLLIDYYKQKYNYILKPVNHRNGNPISKDICCPKCGATYDYIYENNGGKGQMHCKVCKTNFTLNEPKPITLICPYCGRTLSPRKERKHFTIHKCTNPSCSYYLSNLKKLPKAIKPSEKFKYKLHYIYREFNINFFKIDLHSISDRAVNFNFRKFNPHIMGLCLT